MAQQQVEQQTTNEINPCSPVICPRFDDALCGIFGKTLRTFESDCDFEVANCETNGAWKIVKRGECPDWVIW